MTRYISPNDTRYDDAERALVRVGRDGIATGDDAALDEYFSADFVFHGPDGDLDYDELKAFFAALRDSFSGFACERSELIHSGSLIGARTTMSGVFTKAFEMTPVGRIEPTGATLTLELINFFRYDDDGLLAEEWVQYDSFGMLRQLGVTLVPADQNA